MTHQDLCIHCKDPVGARQEGIQCDGCDRWQHRTCNSGITREQYRNAVRNGQGIDWRCVGCLNMSAGIISPIAESSRIGQGNLYPSYKYTWYKRSCLVAGSLDQ